MKQILRIGTRKSALALAQTRLFVDACQAACGEAFSYEIVEISTAGDQILDQPLYRFEGKGMFISAFEKALEEGSIDVAVHSGKDMPTELPDSLTVAAVLPRAHAGDVLVLSAGKALTRTSVIGTGSLRRRAQVRACFGCACKDLRGNVTTRLEKLRSGQVDGLILAEAGLERLQIVSAADFQKPEGEDVAGAEGVCQVADLLYYRLEREQFLPAPAQGIIAVECRRDSPFLPLLAQINDSATMECFLTERAYLEGVGAGCEQPVAAYSYCKDTGIVLEAAYWKGEQVCRTKGELPIGQGRELAKMLAKQIREQLLSEPLAAAQDKKMQPSDGMNTGRVYLVGAGPGSRALITVQGMELLRDCDTVVYDRLSGIELLQETKPSCERIYVGKQAGRHSMTQEEINALLVAQARAGKCVVRLKGGDPFVFGRGGEEAEYLKQAGIPCYLVPGISSAIAVPELAGIPVTHREVSRSFHVITAQTAGADMAQTREYLRTQIAGIRDAEGTLVFLMGLSVLEQICDLLQEMGRSPVLPAAVIENGSRYNERIIRGTLSDIGERVRTAGLMSPAVILIGETAALSLGEKEEPALMGSCIGMVGTRALTNRLGRALEREGAKALRIQELFPRALAGAALSPQMLEEATWVVFTSAVGVQLFFQELKKQQRDCRALAHLHFAVLGAGTKQALWEQGICADYIPPQYTAEALTEGLLSLLQPGRDRVLLYQAKEGNPVLMQKLQAVGLLAGRAVAYEMQSSELLCEEALQSLSYLTFASCSGVRAFVQAAPGQLQRLARQGVRMVAIGSQTALALQEAGCESVIVPRIFTAEGMAEAIVKAHVDKAAQCGKDAER